MRSQGISNHGTDHMSFTWDTILKYPMKHLTLFFKLTSKDFRNSVAGTGGNVAWLPTKIRGFLARDTSSAHF